VNVLRTQPVLTGPPWWAAACLICLLGVARPSRAADTNLPVLTNAAAVRNLPPEEAARHYPVRIKGLVTFFDQSQFLRFIQDESAGIYFYLNDPADPALQAGQIVEIEGQSSRGEYAPIIEPSRLRLLGSGTFPAAKPVAFELLSSGQEDSQFVEVHGIVRAVRFDAPSKYYQIDLAIAGERVTAVARSLPGTLQTDLVDSTVVARGVCLTRFNRQRQLFNIRLLVPRLEDLVIEKPSAGDSFAASSPPRPINSLLQFTTDATFGHRVKVAGTVIYRHDNTLYIEDKTTGLYIETADLSPLRASDRVEVLGFADRGEYNPTLKDAVCRKTGQDALPVPDEVTADEALKGTHDCRLVRIQATVLDRARHSQEQFLVLQSSGFIFHAYLERKSPGGGVDFAYLQNGSKLAVTGVCVIETGPDWRPGENWRARSFRILLRSPADIEVLQAVPWWNLQKLLWMAAILGVVALAASIWVAVLRRRVHQQTRIISDKLRVEATLKERYQDLYENANDVVYTHDLNGRITSMNRAGEKLLQWPRRDVLSKNILELVAPEEQPAVQRWLEQVGAASSSPTVEWDFLTAGRQRVRLEINARLIQPSGATAEIEVMARDITERKRLEREILEISNREQRRIGHDLHDGVCQQLAGIALMTASLADKLEEKAAPESAQIERISGLINQAITQTRGVARGLFPIRLEENGLVSVLEELAVNSSELFKIPCHFSASSPPAAVDNETALHLYYIVLEAVANAAKHSNAKNIAISLDAVKDHYALSVRDDGQGFPLAIPAQMGMGIRIMQYRAGVIGATLNLRSAPGSGTDVTCVFLAVPRHPAPDLGPNHRQAAVGL
jgi:PAS domain S-box-containing protein